MYLLLILVLSQSAAEFSPNDLCFPTGSHESDLYMLYNAQTGSFTDLPLLSNYSEKYVKHKKLYKEDKDVFVVRNLSDHINVNEKHAEGQVNGMLELISGKANVNWNSGVGASSFSEYLQVIVYYTRETGEDFINPCNDDVHRFVNTGFLRKRVRPIATHFFTRTKTGIIFRATVTIDLSSEEAKKHSSFKIGADVEGLFSGMFNAGGKFNWESDTTGVVKKLKVHTQISKNVRLPFSSPISTALEPFEDYLKKVLPYLESLPDEAGSDIEACMTDLRILRACDLEVEDFEVPKFRIEHVRLLESLVNRLNFFFGRVMFRYQSFLKVKECLTESAVGKVNDTVSQFTTLQVRANSAILTLFAAYRNGACNESSFLQQLSTLAMHLRQDFDMYEKKYFGKNANNDTQISFFGMLYNNGIKCWPTATELQAARFQEFHNPVFLNFQKSKTNVSDFAGIVQGFVLECRRCNATPYLINCETHQIDCESFPRLPAAIRFPNPLVTDIGSPDLQTSPCQMGNNCRHNDSVGYLDQLVYSNVNNFQNRFCKYA